MSRFRFLVIAAMAASFLVSVPTASVAADITGAAASQCANDAPPSTSKACPGGWIGSILQNSNSHYREDEVVPQRLLMTIPAGGDAHTVTISYLSRKGSANAHAFDSLATWNHTQHQATPCQGLAASLCSGPVSTFQMASDTTAVQPVGPGISANTNQHELPAAARQWKMYGATITGTSAVTHSEPTNTSKDDEASVTLTITGSADGGQALLLFGGHLAVSGGSGITRAWGPGMGASFVSGGPYHIGLSALDGKKSTAQNNIQAGAVQPLAPANFTIEKAVDDATATPGQEVEYTVTVTNTGEETGSTTFVDDYDDSLDPSEVTSDPPVVPVMSPPAPCPVRPVRSRVAVSRRSRTPPRCRRRSRASRVRPAVRPGRFPITNTATLAGDIGEDIGHGVCGGCRGVHHREAVDDDTATPGQDVDYTITVTNNGSTSGSTSFVDDFDNAVNPGEVTSDPTGGTCEESNGTLACETSSIAPGGSQTFTYTAAMPETFEGESGTGGCATGTFPITNTATLAGEGADDDAVTVCVEAAAAFTVTKSADDESATPGQEIAYTITVENTGSTSGSTTFVDVADGDVSPGEVTSDPAGAECAVITNTVSCETSSIAPGDTQTFTYTAAMPETFEGESGTGGCETGTFPVTNTVTLAAEAGEDSVTVCVEAAAAFTITKTVDDETATPGQTVTYTITVENTGSAAGGTSFEDDFDSRLNPGEVTSDPTGGTCNEADGVLSCETGSIPAGDTQTFTYSAQIPATIEGESGTGGCDPGFFPVANNVTLDGEAGDDSVTVCVEAAAAFTVTKSADDESATPGQEITYTITVENTGSTSGATSFVDVADGDVSPGGVTSDPDGAECAVITNTVSCETSSIAPGDTQTFTYTAAMPETFEGESGTGGCETGTFPVTNTVTLAGEAGEDSVTVCVEAAAAFTVEKTADAETATPGQEVTYTITVTNNGTASGSTSFVDDFDDDLDPGEVTSDPTGGTCDESGGTLSCETGSIPAGDTQTFTYTATLPDTFENESGTGGCDPGFFPVANSVTLDGDAGDDGVTVCVEAAPAFTIEKTADAESATPGQDVVYTITVTNTARPPGRRASWTSPTVM